MPLTPSGRRAIRRAPKDPVRVAVGARNAQSDNHVSKHGQVRSSHLGYDCYVTGSVNTIRRVRVILRANRLPPHIPTDARLILPTEMWWPEPDHRASHGMVDAVIGFDLGTLRAFKAQWPEHVFGFEQFLEHAERRRAAVQEEALPPVPTLPGRTDGQHVHIDGGAALPRQLALFPSDVQSVEPHGRINHETYSVRTAIVRFVDGLAALRVDIVGELGEERVLCSRAYVDLVDGRFEIVKHYPGRLRALGMPLGTIYTVLGVRPPRRLMRRELAARQQPSKFSHDRANRMRSVQAVFLDGPGAAAGPVPPKQLPEPVAVEGNARYERELASRADDPTEFPAAPGQLP